MQLWVLLNPFTIHGLEMKLRPHRLALDPPHQKHLLELTRHQVKSGTDELLVLLPNASRRVLSCQLLVTIFNRGPQFPRALVALLIFCPFCYDTFRV
jgi:hypothetical protein